MFQALASSGELIDPVRDVEARCPLCLTPVIAKMGEIVVHHWAHVSLEECDEWAEPASTWHKDWQGQFDRAWREFPMPPHRADIRLPNGFVVEFQRSHIPVAQIREREAFYGRMLWVFDCTEAWKRGDLTFEPSSGFFRWRRPRKSIAACTKAVLLGVGEFGLLELRPHDVPDVVEEDPPEDDKAGDAWAKEPEPTTRELDAETPMRPWPAEGFARLISRRAFIAGVHVQALTPHPVFGVL